MRWGLSVAAAMILQVGCMSEDPPDPGAPPDAGVDDVGLALDGATDGRMGPADANADDGPRPVADGSASPDATIPDAGAPDAMVPDDCLRPAVDALAEQAWQTDFGRSTVRVEGRPCARRFTLTTDAELRHDIWPGERAFAEDPSGPVVRTGDAFFDALYALAIVEAGENAVEAIRDGAFAEGRPVPCPPGGCYETGRLWTYVWTRDTAYAVDLGLAAIDPIRARNSLAFKAAAPRSGGPRRIVQDTGTGGSWPVSTDRVVWALGARAALEWLPETERDAFATLAREALEATLEDDDAVVFDPVTELYRGEQSFLDWREQSYPDWVTGRPAPIAMSRTLGTNIGHLVARRLARDLALRAGDEEAATRWGGSAARLQTAIRGHLVGPAGALPAAYLMGDLDPGPAFQADLLGISLAILEGVLEPDEALQALSAYPVLPGGPPVIWPQQQFTPIYHNRGQWPFVTAYWLRAGARVRHAAVVDAGVEVLMRGAALHLSNMENFEVGSGRAFVDEGDFSGPVVNSERQLWSVAGYLAMVHEVIFGIRLDEGLLHIDPRLTRTLREARFSRTQELVLSGLRWRDRTLDVVVHLPPVGQGEGAGYRVAETRVDGAPVEGPIELGEVEPGPVRIDVVLEPDAWPDVELTRLPGDADWRAVFGPRAPSVRVVSGDALVRVFVEVRDMAEDVRVELLRDGVVIDGDVRGLTVDRGVGPDDRACYVARAIFPSGNVSQPSDPQCWWGGDRVTAFGPDELDVVEGELADEHGRRHVRDPGGGGVAVPAFAAAHDGRHLIQVVYGNGAGSVETGITCGVRRVDVTDGETGARVGGGYLALPHLGAWDRWADSTFVAADLVAGRRYRIAVHADDARAVNMSWLDHFADYGGAGGVGGPFNAVNIAEVKVLAFD